MPPEKTLSFSRRTKLPGGTPPPKPRKENDRRKWRQLQARLRSDLGETIWRHWLRHLVFDEKTGSSIVLGAPSRMIASHISSCYADRIRANCRLEWPETERVEIIKITEAGTLPDIEEAFDGDDAHHIGPDDDFEDFGSRIDTRMVFRSFITDASNEFAHGVAMQAAEAVSPKFNPLFIHGGVGLGKTHLLHAIANHIREHRPRHRVVYMTAETFMTLFVKSLRHNDMEAFKERFRSVDVLMIDDIQFIDSGEKKSTREEMLHTLSALMNDNKQVILAADRPATEFTRIGDRLRSRLNWGMVAGIKPATQALRLGIIEARNAAGNIGLDREVMEFLAEKITSNLRELEGALNRIEAHAALLHGKVMDIDAVRGILADVLQLNTARITIAGIKRAVAAHFGIATADMDSRRRSQTIVLPRHVAMYLAKELTTGSYPEIGRHFGGRDHTTVMHGVGKITRLVGGGNHEATDRALADTVAMLRARLSTSGC